MLSDSDSQVRRTAAEVLADLPNAEVVAGLSAVLNDSSPRVREAAEQSLDEIHKHGLEPPPASAFWGPNRKRSPVSALVGQAPIARSLLLASATRPGSEWVLVCAASRVALTIAVIYFGAGSGGPRREPGGSSKDVFGELCDAHDLNRLERALLVQLATSYEMPQPGAVRRSLDPGTGVVIPGLGSPPLRIFEKAVRLARIVRPRFVANRYACEEADRHWPDWRRGSRAAVSKNRKGASGNSPSASTIAGTAIAEDRGRRHTHAGTSLKGNNCGSR